MESREVTWSSFLRDPTRVDRWLREGDVVLRRRDGEPLRLTREGPGLAEREAHTTAARLLDPVGRPSRGAARRAARLLPWTRFLPEAARRAFVEEFLECFVASADLGEFGVLAELLGDWRNTASLYAE